MLGGGVDWLVCISKVGSQASCLLFLESNHGRGGPPLGLQGPRDVKTSQNTENRRQNVKMCQNITEPLRWCNRAMNPTQ